MLNRRGYLFIFIAIMLGIIGGWSGNFYIIKAAEIVSELFVRLLKLVSLPMISLALLATLAGSSKDVILSNMGKRIVGYTLLTTMMAACIALGLYELIAPALKMVNYHPSTLSKSASYLQELIKMVPENLVEPFLEGNVVSILLLSLLIGMGIRHLPDAQRQPLHNVLQGLFNTFLQITRWIVSLMPVAIWGFICTFIIDYQKGNPANQLGWYLTTVLAANVIQAVIVLPLFLIAHRIKPIHAFKNMLPAISFAFFLSPQVRLCLVQLIVLSKI